MAEKAVKRVYGHPKEKDQAYLPEIYCATCNKVPVFDIWQGSKHEGMGIDDLYPIPVNRINIKGEMEVNELMLCWQCVERIGEQMKAQMAKAMTDMMRRKRPPGDLGEPGGGVPAK